MKKCAAAPMKGRDLEPSGRVVTAPPRPATPAQRTAPPSWLADGPDFRARFEQTALAQMVHDMTGVIVDVNPAMCALVGRSRQELLGHTTRILHHPSDVAAGRLRAQEIFAGRIEAAHWERVFSTPDGAPVPVLIQCSLVRDAQGRPDTVHSFVQDLTQLRTAERNLRRSTARYEALLSGSTDWTFVADARGDIVFAAPAVRTALGHGPSTVDGSNGLSYVHPDDRDSVLASWQELLAERGGRREVVCRVRAADGSWVWVEAVATNRLDHAEVNGVVWNVRDVTERMAAQEAVRASEARYRAIAETAQEGIWVTDLAGRTVFANRKIAEILGLEVDVLYAVPAPQLLTPGDPTTLLEKMAHRAERGAETYELEYAHPDGGLRYLRMSVSPLDEDGVASSLAMISDITDVREAQEQLRRMALRDALTGLPNRALMLDRIEHALARAGRSEAGAVAVLLLDLDDFKLVNDSWGHAAGDTLLQQVAARLQGVVRAADTVARFGGDEFVILCEGLTEQQVHGVAGRVAGALSERFGVGGHQVHIAASIGIAMSPPLDAETLIRYADTAMYEAKASGRGQWKLFDVALAQRASEQLLLGQDLREALAAGELTLHYQPVVRLDTGRIAGLEGLARWQHPTRGNVPPGVFVDVALRLGLSPVLDRWAVSTAVADGVRLREALPYPMRVGVNVSAANIADPELEAHLLAAAEASGGHHDLLIVEITEDALVANPEAARETLRRLGERGVQAAIDDFGTGYSSLAYLSQLPVQSVKIDRSFIARLEDDADARSITAAIIELAKTLGLRTVAEGVETPGQLALLRELGCWGAQGWLWSKALPYDEVVALVESLPDGRFDVGA